MYVIINKLLKLKHNINCFQVHIFCNLFSLFLKTLLFIRHILVMLAVLSFWSLLKHTTCQGLLSYSVLCHYLYYLVPFPHGWLATMELQLSLPLVFMVYFLTLSNMIYDVSLFFHCFFFSLQFFHQACFFLLSIKYTQFSHISTFQRPTLSC